LSGQLVLGSAAAAYREGIRLLRDGSVVAVDAADLQAIDSSGIAVLLAWMGQRHGEGRTLRIVGLSDAALALARVGGVAGLFSAETA
jgi:ABC-type transporter Mla MlaB component